MRPVSTRAGPPYAVGSGFHLADIDPGDTGKLHKGEAAVETEVLRGQLDKLQERLYAEHRRSLLVVLQAIDTGGKDGTIRHTFGGINPQGCEVSSFKAPTPQELDHDFLRRYHRRAPGRGLIGVFNRSHYEDVLVVRVKQLATEAVWRPRYAAINAFEAQLTAAGTTVVKFFLHISRDEQRRRLESRLADPDKRWKFSVADLAERERWDAYQSAFDEALRRCSTADAPWWVVPADHKWARNRAVLGVLVDTLETMDPRFPMPAAGLDRVVVPR